MDKCRKNIVILEPSLIIYEGLYVSISKSDYDYSFYHVLDFKEIEILLLKNEISVILVNPVLVQNRTNEFLRIKKQNKKIYWIAIIYSFFDKSILKLFDSTFQLTEDAAIIIRKINKICTDKSVNKITDEHLSERETEVLKYLAKGFSNKETAHRLNISIHTVNTHRKNIMDKTGIRSLAGLTVYAISKDIIPLDS
jgi:DNA-binding CsgD family transcriptional regulator